MQHIGLEGLFHGQKTTGHTSCRLDVSEENTSVYFCFACYLDEMSIDKGEKPEPRVEGRNYRYIKNNLSLSLLANVLCRLSFGLALPHFLKLCLVYTVSSDCILFEDHK